MVNIQALRIHCQSSKFAHYTCIVGADESFYLALCWLDGVVIIRTFDHVMLQHLYVHVSDKMYGFSNARNLLIGPVYVEGS